MNYFNTLRMIQYLNQLNIGNPITMYKEQTTKSNHPLEGIFTDDFVFVPNKFYDSQFEKWHQNISYATTWPSKVDAFKEACDKSEEFLVVNKKCISSVFSKVLDLPTLENTELWFEIARVEPYEIYSKKDVSYQLLVSDKKVYKIIMVAIIPFYQGNDYNSNLSHRREEKETYFQSLQEAVTFWNKTIYNI